MEHIPIKEMIEGDRQTLSKKLNHRDCVIMHTEPDILQENHQTLVNAQVNHPDSYPSPRKSYSICTDIPTPSQDSLLTLYHPNTNQPVKNTSLPLCYRKTHR